LLSLPLHLKPIQPVPNLNRILLVNASVMFGSK